ncbi:Disease resistance protein RPP13, partial [Camellia lanceoleosa]
MAHIALAGATAVLRQTVGVLGNLVLKEGSRLSRLREDIVWIEREMRHIQAYLEDAEAKQGGTRGVANLVIDIQDLAFDVEDIMQKYFPRIASHRGKKFLGCLKSARNFVVEIEGIKRRVEDINRVRQTYGINESSGSGGRDINLVFREGSRLSGLREDIVWIEREMRHVQAYLEDAEAKQGRSRGVANLVIDIQDLACDKEGVLGCLKSATCIVCYGYDTCNFAVEIEGIKRRLEDINRVRQTYGINKSSRSGGRDVWGKKQSFPRIDEPNVVGFEKHIENLVAKMLDTKLQCRVISIIGMAGLGKTTLTKKVFKSVQHSFECSAWIYVSQQPNIKELLQDIARQMGLEKGKCEETVEVNLFTFLSQHRYVINGRRIILTSQNRDVGSHVGRKSSLHELRPLNEENGRKFFFKMVMVDLKNINETSNPPQLENIGEQILKRCGGVLLAIKGILEGMGQDRDQCSEIFALSYKDLPTYLKPCFLYFGLFPKDHEISAFELINLWTAEGFIEGSGVREVEDVGDDYLNHLIARNLIQVVRRRFNGKVSSCCIHTILHNLCIREAKEINFFNTRNDVITSNLGLGVCRVITHGSNFNDYISLNYPTPKLCAMLCFSGDLRNVRRKMCDYFPTTFPNEVGNLKNLYYLGLGFTGYKKFEHVLLPKFCEKVPSLGGVNLDRFHPMEICLPNLQTLYGLREKMVCDFIFLHKLANLRNLRVSISSEHIIEVLSNPILVLTKLEKLHIGNLSRYENLLSLNLCYLIVTELPQHDKLPLNLTKITFVGTSLKKDPMETLKKLPKLKILKLYSHSYWGNKM